jgi:hypothetical protein
MYVLDPERFRLWRVFLPSACGEIVIVHYELASTAQTDVFVGKGFSGGFFHQFGPWVEVETKQPTAADVPKFA